MTNSQAAMISSGLMIAGGAICCGNDVHGDSATVGLAVIMAGAFVFLLAALNAKNSK